MENRRLYQPILKTMSGGAHAGLLLFVRIRLRYLSEIATTWCQRRNIALGWTCAQPCAKCELAGAPSVWLFSRYGFYSIASASQANGLIDSETVMIRARRAAHLRNIQQRFAALAGDIVTLPNRDNRYRLIVSKEVWAGILSDLGSEQEWTNFKHEAARFNGHDEYVNALHKITRSGV